MAGNIIIGIDEVGRGPWAGPLTAAAVAFDSSVAIECLTDSKQLSQKHRAKLFQEIVSRSVSIGVGWCPQLRLDEVGLQQATSEAMYTALEQISPSTGDIVIDGSYNYLDQVPGVKTQVGGDSTVPAISAASIIAKQLRDEYMSKMSRIYPDYGFEAHKGYGTAAHRQALEVNGACALHRHSFAPIKLYKGARKA